MSASIRFPGAVVPSADISHDGIYRYRLGRRWDDGPTMLLVMLNPSTADAERDDPTIRRCLGFARREKMGAIEVVNLFAFRATDPRELVRAPIDIVGVRNDYAIGDAAAGAAIVVCAWGVHVPRAWDRRPFHVCSLLIGRQLLQLGASKTGAPLHPLYRPGDVPLVPLGTVI